MRGADADAEAAGGPGAEGGGARGGSDGGGAKQGAGEVGGVVGQLGGRGAPARGSGNSRIKSTTVIPGCSFSMRIRKRQQQYTTHVIQSCQPGPLCRSPCVISFAGAECITTAQGAVGCEAGVPSPSCAQADAKRTTWRGTVPEQRKATLTLAPPTA